MKGIGYTTVLIGLLMFSFGSSVGLPMTDKSLHSVNPNLATYTDEVPWGVNQIGAPQVWNKTLGSKGVTVAVIDSGIDLNHPDLKQNIWNNTKEIPNNGIDDDHNGFIDDIHGWNFFDNNNDVSDKLTPSHGTHVSGIIAAEMNNLGVVGVAPNVTIMPLKVFGTSPNVSIGISNAIDYAVNNGANIISMSLGGSNPDYYIEQAVRNAWEKGLVIVAANGNEGAKAPVSYPAAYPEVIAVAATTDTNNIASFSNSGTQTEISAPGVLINSTMRVGSVIKTSLSINGTLYQSNPMQYSPPISTPIVYPLEYVNLGLPSDFIGKNLTGKIALIERGQSYFKDKVGNASKAGALGVIIFNNKPGNFLGNLITTAPIPAFSISQLDGQNLVSELQKNISMIANMSSIHTDWGVLSGTSMATPHVSGSAALLWSYNSSLTNYKIRQILDRSTTDLGINGRDSYYGYGLLNVSRAVEVVNDKQAPKILSINLNIINSINPKISGDIHITDDVGLYSVESRVIENGVTAYLDVFSIASRSKDSSPLLGLTVGLGLTSLKLNLTISDMYGHTTSKLVDLSSQYQNVIISTSSSSSPTTNRASTPLIGLINSLILISISVRVVKRKKRS